MPTGDQEFVGPKNLVETATELAKTLNWPVSHVLASLWGDVEACKKPVVVLDDSGDEGDS